MREILERALDTAVAAGATYADCRGVQQSTGSVTVKNGLVAEISEGDDAGVGIRVIVDGCWGFAGIDRFDGPSIDAAVTRAVRIARASRALNRDPVRLAPQQVQLGEYRTPFKTDPFAVPLERKIDLLMAADAAMNAGDQVMAREGSFQWLRERRHFASSEGSRTDQSITETGLSFNALATNGSDMQMRSWPNSFGTQQLATGWELVEGFDLETEAARIAGEAVALLSADPCPEGRMTVILDASQAALQVHESCGHPTELDRVLGDEAAFAGMSFLTPELMGTFRYGSEAVTLTADATSPTGLGTFGWDDEGVPAQRTVLVDRGLFSGYMTSRESAASMGWEASSGTMRAEGWNRIPLIRMTNVNLEPGTSSLEEMIAGTEHGVYLETNRSWSIDDVRLNFQFGTQVGWEIRDGKRVRMVRNPLYSGITPEFWNSCDAVSGPDEWQLWGLVNCGKGQPVQGMHVGHGAAPARFRNVQVGVAG
jgi:TldD protein